MKKIKINWFYAVFVFLILCGIAGLFLLNNEINSFFDLKKRVAAVSKTSLSDGIVFSDVGKVNDIFIENEGELLDFIKTIEASKVNFKDLNIGFAEDKLTGRSKKDKYKYLTFTLEFTAPYDKGVEFVNKLHSASNLLRIATFEASGKEDFKNSAYFTVTGRLFVSDKYSQ